MLEPPLGSAIFSRRDCPYLVRTTEQWILFWLRSDRSGQLRLRQILRSYAVSPYLLFSIVQPLEDRWRRSNLWAYNARYKDEYDGQFTPAKYYEDSAAKDAGKRALERII